MAIVRRNRRNAAIVRLRQLAAKCAALVLCGLQRCLANTLVRVDVAINRLHRADKAFEMLLEGRRATRICKDRPSVWICCVNADNAGRGYAPEDVCCWTLDVDYAPRVPQQWPIIVKVRPDLSEPDIRCHLLYLARSLKGR